MHRAKTTPLLRVESNRKNSNLLPVLNQLWQNNGWKFVKFRQAVLKLAHKARYHHNSGVVCSWVKDKPSRENNSLIARLEYSLTSKTTVLLQWGKSCFNGLRCITIYHCQIRHLVSVLSLHLSEGRPHDCTLININCLVCVMFLLNACQHTKYQKILSVPLHYIDYRSTLTTNQPSMSKPIGSN